ncbi:MarR family winged helix-turn-helix transcriptional regulator [Burkholderia ubonensis]|uniref:MarR family winged helix-turn-helix transcriptional regulator n=1 Tax=Burkholderia ubonensis TaxID=101571 RepID=UPI00075E8AE2|nr:MarR family transcriptional regulator [Burkholderia ubonensis]KVS39917.1 MarR family transcriptional regulator [Burkholderia ubonensis]KVS48012.1 MarR family transcriptional regulator [Burkholderia ubonensis]KVS78746.1 MarR family transcriptional regulator [Burkholderia ubonensis]KVS93453.1 MarR family transcriptional regulator [Burkholderia ubonensis]KVS94198.1 MarR family transcriptional regulator [Burkholderia ubonensis]
MHSIDLIDDDCFALRQASRHISKLYEHHLSAVDITPTQFSILSMLAVSAGLTMVELAKAMVMDRTTLVRALKPLLRRGLVATVTETKHRRQLQVVLTTGGLQKLNEAAVHWAAAQASFERDFGSLQAAHLRRELFRMTHDTSDG